jgi:cysteine-rich repeat protein
MALHNQATPQYGDTFRSASIRSVFAGSTATRGGGICGDSSPDAGEECDDGNVTSGDGCSATCTYEPGFDCSPAIAGSLTENILVDGSFEDGNIGGEWTSINRSLFGANLICGDGCFGRPFAAAPDGSLTSGNYVLIAGGSFASSSVGNATHASVVIPANATTLEFQWATLASGPGGDPCAGPTDGLALSIGGTPVWANTDGGPCTNVNPYERVVIDLATAPGGPYQGTTVAFEFTASATGVPPNVDLTNVMLDDVSINIPADPIIPPMPSSCTAVVCGDGVFAQFNAAESEECDDGNSSAGDGCSSSCTVEQANFICDDPEPAAASDEDVADGGLEDGSPNPNWTQTGTEFEPICSQAFCSGALAVDGAFFGWFGGSSLPNAQTLTQDVTISSTATDLTFELLVGVCDSAADSLTVEIDATEIFRYDCTANTATYQLQTVPLGAFADGGTHTLQFIGNTVAANAGNSNFFVDNISIEDNVAFGGAPSSCFELNAACNTPEEFSAGIPAGWTVINLGADAADGWGASNDGICASQNWSGGNAENNTTGGGGIAACADSDATGQIDLDGGAPDPLAMDTYLCSPPLDLTNVTDPTASFLVNFQSADNDFNDNGTPDDRSDDFDDDFLQVLVGTVAPSSLSVPNYDVLGNVFDHLDSTLALSEEAALAASLTDYNAETAAHVCFHYRGTYAWFAQIDNFAVSGSSCTAPTDTDLDGVPDSIDNCINLANATQLDTDGDGHGNRCDADLNNDCIVNPIDLGLFKSVFFTADPDADYNGDGQVNPIDLGIFKSLFFQPVGPSASPNLCGNLP